MLDKKEIRVITLHKFKIVLKQRRQPTSIAHLVRKMLKKAECSGGSRNNLKKTRAFQITSLMAVNGKLTTTS